MESAAEEVNDLAIDQDSGLDAPIEIPEKLAALGVTESGIKALAGGLVEHATNAHDAETVENPGKPADVPLPLEEGAETFERFNANAAMSAIIAKNREVESDRRRWKDSKQQAADDKKTLDDSEAALARLISHFEKAREQQNSPQAFLPIAGDGSAAVDSNCPWERAHPGLTCVICREAKKANLSPNPVSSVHPEHAEHAQVAGDAHDETVLMPLVAKLKAKNFYSNLLELQELPGGYLQTLIEWVDQDGIVPPPVLATSHLADAPGTMAQSCVNCKTSLALTTDAEGLYPEGARVGFDCFGIQVEVDGPPAMPDEPDPLVETTGLDHEQATAKTAKAREKGHRYPKAKAKKAKRR